MSGPVPAKRIVLCGATGSIGESVLDVVRHRPDRFEIVAMMAHRRVDALERAARELGPEAVCLADDEANRALAARLRDHPVRVLDGADRVEELARWPGADVLVNAVVGAAGLGPSLAAIDERRTLALANKETLVVGGEIVTARARDRGVQIVPIDSEHCSLFQCLLGRPPGSVHRLVLTASGGPFRARSLTEVDALDPAAALAHPTWDMGPRITVDSATLMNKGLEVIEAHWLFGVAPDDIDVVVHPQSIVHALVTLSDGSQIAHLSRPDMRLPIDFVLSWPDAPPRRFAPLDLAEAAELTFEAPDRERFPCLALAEASLRAGGVAPAVLNAADEVAVEGYLGGRIRFTEIPMVVSDALDHYDRGWPLDLDAIAEADAWARDHARAAVTRRGR